MIWNYYLYSPETDKLCQKFNLIMAALKFFISLLRVPLSLIAAIAGILAFMAGYISPVSSGLITYTGLGMPVILLINLGIAIYWIIYKSYWSLLSVAILILNMGYLTSIFQISFSSEQPKISAPQLRIATYNVGNFRSWEKQDTQHPISDFLQKANTDIACFQEYNERNKINADSLGKLLNLPYHAIEYLPGTKSYNSAIFSRYPIIDQGHLPFKSKINDAMWADIQIDSQILRVINCHLETTNFSRKRKELKGKTMESFTLERLTSLYRDISSTLLDNSRIRAAQAKMVRAFIDSSPYPVIVCGDFNDPPSSYTYHHIKGKLKDSFKSRGNGYGYTFRGIHHLLRIDYILYSPSLKCMEYISEEKNWSDHNPIICNFYL